MRFYNILFEVSRVLLTGLFIYTGFSKLIGYYLFLDQLLNIPILKTFAYFISIFIPVIEIATAIILAFPKTEKLGWWLSAILMSIFSIYIAIMLMFVPRLPCSCGGIIASLSWKQHLILNIVLATICWLRLYQHHFISKFSINTKEVS